MSADSGPLAHVPDPNDRFQVFAYMHGAEIYVEIVDKQTGSGLEIPPLEALKVAGNINQQLA